MRLRLLEYKAKDENLNYEKELNAQLAKLQKTRQKYMDMYADDLISREELNDKIGGMRKEIERLENELKMVAYHLTKGEQLESVLGRTFKEIEDITDVHQMTNAQLKRIIQKIEVDKDGNVDIYLRLLGDLGLDETVLIHHDETDRRLACVQLSIVKHGGKLMQIAERIKLIFLAVRIRAHKARQCKAVAVEHGLELVRVHVAPARLIRQKDNAIAAARAPCAVTAPLPSRKIYRLRSRLLRRHRCSESGARLRISSSDVGG